MKVILFGSNGYIGQNLTLFLLDAGVELTCFDIQEEPRIQSGSERFSYSCLDVTKPDQLENIDWNADAIIYMAGLTGTKVSIDKAALFTSVNEIGLVNVLQSMTTSGFTPHFIFPSTRLIYKGKSGSITEHDEKEFKTVYALNKFSCENLLKIYASYSGLKYSVFRICVPYGNLGSIPFSYGTIGFMLQQAKTGSIVLYGDGSQRRTFSHVGDISSALYKSINSDVCYNETFNIGGEGYSLLEVAEMISQKTGCTISKKEWPEIDLKLESGDTVFNSEKMDRLLAFKNEYSLQSWISEL